jgi:hypothetical protein
MDKKKRTKPRFRIGDYVAVSAVTESTIEAQEPLCVRKLSKSKLDEPVRGWIVGMIRRFEGKIHPSCSKGEDYEGGYLGVTGSKLLWKVTRSMMGKPMEVADEDVCLAGASSPAELFNCPLKLGTPWGMAGWSPEDQRKEMKAWPRDEKGRWLKKGK